MDFLCSSILLIFLPTIILINTLCMNLRGTPGPLRDHPSCGDHPITGIQPTVVRAMVSSSAVINFKYSVRTSVKTPNEVTLMSYTKHRTVFLGNRTTSCLQHSRRCNCLGMQRYYKHDNPAASRDASHSVWEVFLKASVSVNVVEASGSNTREVVS
jgi:hypothetical protein